MRKDNTGKNRARSQRGPGRTVLVATATLLAVVISAAPANAATENYISVINGGQELGPTTSSSIGNAFLTFDPASKMLCYAISFTALDFPETAAHFHGPASAGEGAGVLFGINAPAGPSIEGSPKTGCVGPFEARAQGWLKQGKVYINIHSTMFPAGEIRGQVIPVGGN